MALCLFFLKDLVVEPEYQGNGIGRVSNVQRFAVYGQDKKGIKMVCSFLEVIQMDLMKTGKFIAELRKEKGLTQEQFGEKVGVTNKTVSRWETGTYLPSADALLIMSELFDVSINELLSGKKLTEKKNTSRLLRRIFQQTIKSSQFSLKEKIDFYKKKMAERAYCYHDIYWRMHNWCFLQQVSL